MNAQTVSRLNRLLILVRLLLIAIRSRASSTDVFCQGRQEIRNGGVLQRIENVLAFFSRLHHAVHFQDGKLL